MANMIVWSKFSRYMIQRMEGLKKEQKYVYLALLMLVQCSFLQYI